MTAPRSERSTHYAQVSQRYDALAAHGKFATQAPHNKGGRKGEYIAAVFDAALLPLLARGAPHAHLLDFGCGTGVFTAQAATYAELTVGIDVSLRMLGAARALCPSHVALVQTDGRRLPFAADAFDRIVARESLCYVPDEEFHATLVEIRRVLRADGRLLWLEQVSESSHWQRHASAPHMVKRSPADLRAAAAAAGLVLELERVVRTPRFPWIYPIAAGLLPRRAIALLARWEVAWHRRRSGNPGRWWNALYVLRKNA